jgi:hypothetical protein
MIKKQRLKINTEKYRYSCIIINILFSFGIFRLRWSIILCLSEGKS